MPGMSSGLSITNAAIVSAFQSALLHQLLVVAVIFAVLALAWNLLRGRELAKGTARASRAAVASVTHEPAARRVLRISFGFLWIFDGILQAQASMPLGMPSQVIQPTALASPHWVQHLVNAGTTIWSNHPIAASTSAVWIQVGIGALLLVAPRGRWSQFGGLLAAGWGVLVWIFGESFGGIFAPGLTWLFGAPGAVVFYVVAGLLVALPERRFFAQRLGRLLLGALGAFFLGMATLQAWPGRGFWTGSTWRGGHRTLGTLAGMTDQMAATPQPHWLSSAVASFTSFDAAHGWGVNLFAVIFLSVVGAIFLAGRRALLRFAVVALAVVALADWLFVEDLGFMGGTGTDPNSMLPMLLVAVTGYLAIARAPAAATSVAPDGVVSPLLVSGGAIPALKRRLGELDPAYAFRALGACGALGVALLGAAPMAAASANTSTDPILAQSIGGPPLVEDVPAVQFSLTDQQGRSISLAGLHGKTVLLTFLDPVCTSDCPIIAEELRQADALLGPSASKVAIVAVDANPLYFSPAFPRAFDRQENLDQLTNWHFVTGSLADLSRMWAAYGLQVQVNPGGSMAAHNDIAYVIDGSGHARRILNTDTGPGTRATKSSFATLLSQQLRQVMAGS